MDSQAISENQIAAQPSHRTAYDLFVLLLTTASLTLVAVMLVLGPGDTDLHSILVRVDFLICVVFLYDFVLMLLRAPRKIDYLLKQGGWLDLAGAVPVLPGASWTALLRFARLNRMRRIVRQLRGRERRTIAREALEAPAGAALLTVIFLAFLLITAASMLILRAEDGASGAEITNGADAFWWAVVTITTVGYGDYAPVTGAGRIIAIALMVFGISIFAVLTNFVASRMPNVPGEDPTLATIAEENARIRAELAAIKRLLQRDKAPDAAGEETEETTDG